MATQVYSVREDSFWKHHLVFIQCKWNWYNLRPWLFSVGWGLGEERQAKWPIKTLHQPTFLLKSRLLSISCSVNTSWFIRMLFFSPWSAKERKPDSECSPLGKPFIPQSQTHLSPVPHQPWAGPGTAIDNMGSWCWAWKAIWERSHPARKDSSQACTGTFYLHVRRRMLFTWYLVFGFWWWTKEGLVRACFTGSAWTKEKMLVRYKKRGIPCARD